MPTNIRGTYHMTMTLAAGAFVCVCIMHVMIYVSCCVVDKFMYLLKVLNEDDPMMSWIRFDSFCSTSVTLCILPFIYFITHMHILVIRRVLRRSRGAVQPQQVHPPQVPVPGGAALAGLGRRRRHRHQLRRRHGHWRWGPKAGAAAAAGAAAGAAGLAHDSKYLYYWTPARSRSPDLQRLQHQRNVLAGRLQLDPRGQLQPLHVPERVRDGRLQMLGLPAS
jgi:hypothetical protein